MFLMWSWTSEQTIFFSAVFGSFSFVWFICMFIFNKVHLTCQCGHRKCSWVWGFVPCLRVHRFLQSSLFLVLLRWGKSCSSQDQHRTWKKIDGLVQVESLVQDAVFKVYFSLSILVKQGRSYFYICMQLSNKQFLYLPNSDILTAV